MSGLSMQPELANQPDQDFNWRRQAEEERDRLFELTGELMFIVGKDGFLRRVSLACTRVLGWSTEELLGRRYTDFVHPDDRQAASATARRALAGETLSMQSRVQCKDGSWRMLIWSVSPVNSRTGTLCGVGRDLTAEQEKTERLERIIAERARAEERLRASLEEKAVLLREIHHRVKNNLAVISSQLYLQSSYVTDSATIQMLYEIRDRVRSMALVHETLYQSGSLAEVEAGDYIRALADHLLRSYRSPLVRVALDLEIAPVRLNLEAAIPCGLILTELLTNCLKHAFAPGDAGHVRVSLIRTDEGQLRLDVVDDGVGMPKDVDVTSSRSLGLRLVRSLAAQLDADLELMAEGPGTRVRMSFEHSTAASQDEARQDG